ncbi:MAG: hypothetical protein ACRELV_03735 [Longimicrobiales bacterium]
MRTVYSHGVLMTAVKWWLLGFCYFVTFSLALAFGMLATLALG